MASNNSRRTNERTRSKYNNFGNQQRISQSSSFSEPEKVMECPICYDTMCIPIIQCEQGHAMCQSCVRDNHVNNCPICRGPMTERRNYPLEQLIESLKDKLKISCYYSNRGCKYSLPMEQKEKHEQECRHRLFKCEGHLYGALTCDWTGPYGDLEKHFKERHPNHTSMQFRTKAAIKVDFRNHYKDIQLIPFFNGQSFFYYKYKVDTQNQKLYWTIQYVGLKAIARNYFYEFEISKGDIRKFKVTEICENDTTKAEDIFLKENCVAMTFTAAKSFLNSDSELQISFRIMKKNTTA